MARTAIPPAMTVGAHLLRTDGTPAGPTEPDPYLERLVKYVPAEALAFFTAAATLSDHSWSLAAIGLVALLGANLLAFVARESVAIDFRPPLVWIIGSTSIASVAWVVGTSDVTQVALGIGARSGALVLLCVAFLLPIVDDPVLRGLLRRRGRNE